MAITEEKVLKKVDELLEAVAETIKRSPGMGRIEHVLDRAVTSVKNHPIERAVAVITPHLAKEKING